LMTCEFMLLLSPHSRRPEVIMKQQDYSL
jgi:hypothetical protein